MNATETLKLAHPSGTPAPAESGPGAPEPRSTSRALARALVAGVLGALVGGGGVWGWMQHGHAPATSVSAPPGDGTVSVKPKAQLYQCPMHPTITSDHPGKCPICGMKLVLVDPPAASQANAPQARGVPGLATVTIDPARQQMIGLRTAAVFRGPVSDAWRTVGRVEVDPTRVRRVNVKIDGYVERAFVAFVGQPVRKGQALFSVYSPSLLAAQNEYLLALRTRQQLAGAGALVGGGDDLVAASRRRLELADVPGTEIARLETTGQAARALTLTSPISGVVTTKNIVEGSRLNPGDTPYEITDLSVVWVMADAYETDLPRARIGARATMTLKSFPGRHFVGRVQFVDPVLDPKTRTTKVHLHFPNPSRELKPDMYGEVVLEGRTKTALQIPADAIVRAGTKDIVFVVLGGGKFAPREVRVGVQGDDAIEIVDGLTDGEEVVTRANFLIDSESRLRASLAAIATK